MRFLRSGSLLVILYLMSDDHVTEYVAIFGRRYEILLFTFN